MTNQGTERCACCGEIKREPAFYRFRFNKISLLAWRLEKEKDPSIDQMVCRLCQIRLFAGR